MRSRFSKIVNEVEADLRRRDQASPYFAQLRAGYEDDLMRIEKLHRGGAMLEIGGYPFYFSMCLRKLGIKLTTVDLAPHRAQQLIREQSLAVIKCDIEHEPLPFEDQSMATVALCATFEHLRVDPFFVLEEIRRVLQPGWIALSHHPKPVPARQYSQLCTWSWTCIRPDSRVRELAHRRPHGTRSRVHRIRDATILGDSRICRHRSQKAGAAK